MVIGFPIKQLEGWATLLDVEQTLGYASNQGAYDLVINQRAFGPEDVRYIQMRTQPLYLVRWSALLALKKKRDEAAAQAPEPAVPLLAELRRHVRTRLGAKATGKMYPAQLGQLADILGRPVGGLRDLDVEELQLVLDKLPASA
jgi:hypothetical protein